MDAAIFVENDARRAEDVRSACPAITVQQVADSAVSKDLSMIPSSLELKTNETAELRYKAGIGANDIRAIKQWVAKTAGKHKRAALFDWGRTITQMKGVHATAATEEALESLCGGRCRLTRIRQLFDFLHKNNVKIIILTNNVRARTMGFKRLLVRLLGRGRPFKIIASGLGAARSDKGRALTMRREFRGLCGRHTRKRRS